MSNETMNVYEIEVHENAQGKKCFVYPDYKVGNIVLKGTIIKRVITHNANLHLAIIDAIASLIVQDPKLGVNKIGSILRTCCKIAINNACLSAGVKGVKEGLSNKCIAENMADALLKVASDKKATTKKVTTEKVTKKETKKNADKVNADAVNEAVKIAENQLKARLASKLDELVASSRKDKTIDNMVTELMGLISYLRASDDIVECKLDNIEKVKASKASKSAAKKAKKTK